MTGGVPSLPPGGTLARLSLLARAEPGDPGQDRAGGFPGGAAPLEPVLVRARRAEGPARWRASSASPQGGGATRSGSRPAFPPPPDDQLGGAAAAESQRRDDPGGRGGGSGARPHRRQGREHLPGACRAVHLGQIAFAIEAQYIERRSQARRGRLMRRQIRRQVRLSGLRRAGVHSQKETTPEWVQRTGPGGGGDDTPVPSAWPLPRWPTFTSGGERKHVCSPGRPASGMALLSTVHLSLPLPGCPHRQALVAGPYRHYHYGCDGVDDRGWGCGYRTLQMMCSWLVAAGGEVAAGRRVPSLKEIQNSLVEMGDKPPSFAGSREWIGTVEAALCLDYFYGVPGKLLHIRLGRDLEGELETLYAHFQEGGGPVMMGGGRDHVSKGLLGVCSGPEGHHLLTLDPHYYGPAGSLSRQEAHAQRWVSWRALSSFEEASFYNLCLPQFRAKGPPTLP
ncbi:inactive Ufm1-specific protease 1 [Crotalus adamanteus]|uniref:Inactive Ufm1-specific protease 1 n=1 Tax=Crotalus adamanteus TaxID=8729 RepID=A0AAW1B8Q2_CROAD